MLWILDGGMGPERESSRSALHRALTRLEERQIVHAYWKASRRLGESLSGEGDYDLLVLPEARPLWQSALLEVGFIQARTIRQNRHPQMEHWVGFCPGGPNQRAKLVHLHVHEAPLVQRRGVWEFRLGTAEAVLRSRELDPSFGVYRLSPGMEAVLLVLRSFVEDKLRPGLKGPLSPRGEADLEYIWQRTSAEEIQEAAEQLLPGQGGRRLGATLAMLIQSGMDPWSKEAFINLQGLMEELQNRELRLLPPLEASKSRLSERVNHYSQGIAWRVLPKRLQWAAPQQKLRLHRAPFIAVVGIDGAGKTTLVTALTEWLGTIFETEQLYLGQGDIVVSFWRALAASRRHLRKLNSIITRPLASTESGQDQQGNSGTLELHGYRRALWELSRVARAARHLRKSRLARCQAARGTLVLSDRFPSARGRYASGPSITTRQEAKLLERQRSRLTGYLERVLLERTVKEGAPDFILYLTIAPHTAWKRKPEHHFWEVQQKSEALEQADFGQAKVITLDAEQPFEQVEREAQELIWRALLSVSSGKSPGSGFR